MDGQVRVCKEMQPLVWEHREVMEKYMERLLERLWKATALTWWANSQVISGGPADILKVHFSQWLEPCVVGTKSFRKGGYHQKLEFTLFSKGFPHSSVGKKPTCNAGDLGLIPGSGRSPGEGIGYLLQYCWASLVA